MGRLPCLFVATANRREFDLNQRPLRVFASDLSRAGYLDRRAIPMKKTGKPAPASKQAIAKVLLPAPAVAVVPKATASHGVSVDERFEAGKALRDKIPRTVQAVWKRPSDWPDPVSVLQASDPGRLPELIPIRYGCVLQSPSVFFRGAAAVMAGDMAATPEVAKLHRPATPGVCPLIAKAAAPSPTKSWNVDTAPAMKPEPMCSTTSSASTTRGVGIRNWAISAQWSSRRALC